MQPIANHALHVFPDLNVPGYEASKVRRRNPPPR